MASTTLTVRIDDVLDAQLEAFAAAHGLSRSQATRELLRQVLLDADPVTRGWHEGKAEAFAVTLSAITDAVQSVSRRG